MGNNLAEEQPEPDASNKPQTGENVVNSSLKLGRRSYLSLAATAVAAVAGCSGQKSTVREEIDLQPLGVYGYGGTSVRSRESVSLVVTKSEPNNGRTKATPIELGSPVDGTLASGDTDWYAFDVTDEEVRVDFERHSGDGITVVVLYGPGGEFVDFVYATSSEAVQVLEPIEEGGTHYVELLDVQGGEGEYTLTASQWSSASASLLAETATPMSAQTSASVAAAETTSTDESTARVLSIEGASELDCHYRLAVTGELQASSDFPDSSRESITGSSADGWLSKGEVDEFVFTGEVKYVQLLEGAASFGISDAPSDGEQTTATPTPTATPTEEPSERELRITGVSEQSCHYRVSVTGDLTAAAGFPDGDWESISGSTVDGWVSTGNSDAFTFTGEVDSVELLEGDADLTVDGDAWNGGQATKTPTPTPTETPTPTATPSPTPTTTEEPSERELRITGISEKSCHYRVSVTGELTAAAGFPDGDWESISGNTVDGWVSTGNSDAFSFTGDVDSVELLEGDADFRIDGEPWDGGQTAETPTPTATPTATPTETPSPTPTATEEPTERKLEIEGASQASCHYRVSVTGELTAAAGFPDGGWESISGNTVDGWVSTDNVDAFSFTGDVDSVELLEGDADFRIDGEPWDPNDRPTPTPTPTLTPRPGADEDDYGMQGYGELGYGGISN
jgi:hypothetical protein